MSEKLSRNGIEIATKTEINSSKTMEGDLIHIEDAAPINAEECIINLEPVQDLHGYDKPWPAGGGKNLLPITVEGIKAATGGVWSGNSKTSNGITFTIQTDSANSVISILANGTAEADVYLRLVNTLSTDSDVILSGCPMNGGQYLYRMYAWDGTDYFIDTGTGVNIPANANLRYVTIHIANGYNAQNLLFKPMIRLASDADATFAPYSNICPISGWTECNGSVNNKNWLNSNISAWDTNNRYIYISNIIPKNYTFRITFEDNDTSIDVSGCSLGWVKDINNPNEGFRWALRNGTIQNTTKNTSTSDGGLLQSVFMHPNTNEAFNKIFSRYKIQIELGSTATTYEPCQGTSIPIIFPTEAGIVYGGKVDVINGKLRVENVKESLRGSYFSQWSGGHAVYGTKPNDWLAWKEQENGSAVLFNQGVTTNRIFIGVYPNCVVIGDTTYDSQEYIFLRMENEFSDLATAQNYIESQYQNGTPLEVVYELAEPIEYDLAPHQVQMLLGINNIWADAGTTKLTYQPNNVIGELKGEIQLLQSQIDTLINQLNSLS